MKSEKDRKRLDEWRNNPPDTFNDGCDCVEWFASRLEAAWEENESKAKPPWITRLYFVPKTKIRQALIDMNTEEWCYVRDCYYLKNDDLFAVQVRFKSSYPYLEDQFSHKWEGKDDGMS